MGRSALSVARLVTICVVEEPNEIGLGMIESMCSSLGALTPAALAA